MPSGLGGFVGVKGRQDFSGRHIAQSDIAIVVGRAKRLARKPEEPVVHRLQLVQIDIPDVAELYRFRIVVLREVDGILVNFGRIIFVNGDTGFTQPGLGAAGSVESGEHVYAALLLDFLSKERSRQ